MLTLGCETSPRSIKFRLPPCSQTVDSATLFRPGATTQNLDVGPVTPGDPVEIGPVADDTVGGVWKLMLKTDCGCFEAPVNIPCQPPRAEGEYTPTTDHTPMPECCDTP